MFEIRYRKVADAAYTNFSAATLQTSYIEIIDPNVLPTLVSNHIVNPMSLIQHGYWSWKRTSDILPLDFDVNDK